MLHSSTHQTNTRNEDEAEKNDEIISIVEEGDLNSSPP
jgi:hypothetical protein